MNTFVNVAPLVAGVYLMSIGLMMTAGNITYALFFPYVAST